MPIYLNGQRYGLAAVTKGGGGSNDALISLLTKPSGILDLRSVEITALADYAISRGTWTKVLFPNTLESFGGSSLDSVTTLENGLVDLRNTQLKTLIGNSITDCNIKEIKLPNTIESIGNVGEYNNNLNKFSIEEGGESVTLDGTLANTKIVNLVIKENSRIECANECFRNAKELLKCELSANVVNFNSQNVFRDCVSLSKLIVDAKNNENDMLWTLFGDQDGGGTTLKDINFYLPSVDNVWLLNNDFVCVNDLKIYVPYVMLNAYRNHEFWGHYDIAITDADSVETTVTGATLSPTVVSWKGGYVSCKVEKTNNYIKNDEVVVENFTNKDTYPKQNETISKNDTDGERTLTLTWGDNVYSAQVVQTPREYTYRMVYKVDSTSDDERKRSRFIPINIINNSDWRICDDNGHILENPVIEGVSINGSDWIKMSDFQEQLTEKCEQSGDGWWSGFVMNRLVYIAPNDGEYDVKYRFRNDEVRGKVVGDNRMYLREDFQYQYGRCFDIRTKTYIDDIDGSGIEGLPNNTNIILFEINTDCNPYDNNMIWDNYGWNGTFGGESEGSPMKTFILKSFNGSDACAQILGHQDLDYIVVYEQPDCDGDLRLDRFCGWGTNVDSIVFPNITREIFTRGDFVEGNISHIYVPSDMVATAKTWENGCWSNRRDKIEAIPDGLLDTIL